MFSNCENTKYALNVNNVDELQKQQRIWAEYGPLLDFAVTAEIVRGINTHLDSIQPKKMTRVAWFAGSNWSGPNRAIYDVISSQLQTMYVTLTTKVMHHIIGLAKNVSEYKFAGVLADVPPEVLKSEEQSHNRNVESLRCNIDKFMLGKESIHFYRAFAAKVQDLMAHEGALIGYTEHDFISEYAQEASARVLGYMFYHCVRVHPSAFDIVYNIRISGRFQSGATYIRTS